MELLGTWRSLYTLRYVPITLIQVVFSAGTVFLLSAVQAASGVRLAQVTFSHSLSQAELCIQYLLESGKSFQCANHIAGILGNLLQDQLKSKLFDLSKLPSPKLLSALNSLGDSSSSPSASRSSTSIERLLATRNTPAVQPATYSFHVWDPTKISADSEKQAGSHPQQRAIPTIQPLPGIGFGSPNLGLGMRGGEPLSNRPFMPESESVLPEPESAIGEESHPQLVFTDEDFAALLQVLDHQYPYVPMAD
jgi:hypothetical protein